MASAITPTGSSLPDETGLLYYLISEEDLRARRFDRVFVDYECT